MDVHSSGLSVTPSTTECVSMRLGPSSSKLANGNSKAPLSPSGMRPCSIQRPNCTPCPQMSSDLQQFGMEVQDQQPKGAGEDSVHPSEQWISALESISCAKTPQFWSSGNSCNGSIPLQRPDHVTPRNFSSAGYHRSKRQCVPPRGPSNACTPELQSQAIDNRQRNSPDSLLQSSSSPSRPDSRHGRDDTCASQVRKSSSLGLRPPAHSTPIQEAQPGHTSAPAHQSESPPNDQVVGPKTPPTDLTLDSAQTSNCFPLSSSVPGSSRHQAAEGSESHASDSLAQQPSTSKAAHHQQNITKGSQGAGDSPESAADGNEVEAHHSMSRFSNRQSVSGPADFAVGRENDGRRFGVGGAMMRNGRPHDYRLNSFKQPNEPRDVERVDSRRRREDDEQSGVGLRRKREDDDHFDMGFRRRREDDDPSDVGFRRRREDDEQSGVGLRRKREDDDPSDVGFRRRRGDDDHVDVNDSFHDLDDYGGLDGAVDREEKAYVSLLPRVRQQLCSLRVTSAWPFDREEKNCIVCGYPVRLKGWKGLLQHTENFKKSRITEHRAYFRILSERLKPRNGKLDNAKLDNAKLDNAKLDNAKLDNAKLDDARRDDARRDDARLENAKLENANSNGKAVNVPQAEVSEETMIWPPVLIIDNVNEKESLDRYLIGIKPSDVQRVFRFRDKEHPELGRLLLVFPPSDIGHSNSRLLIDRLDKLFASGACGDDESQNSQLRSIHQNDDAHGGWLTQANGGKTDSHTTRDQDKTSTCSPTTLQMHQPRAFIAEAADMEEMDPEGKHFQWTIEKKRVTPRKAVEESKEDTELVKSPLQNNLSETEHLAELQKQFTSRKILVSQKLKDLEVARQEQKERRVQIARQRSLQLREIDEKFEDELRVLELERVETEREFQRLLEENEIEAEKEGNARIKEMLALATQLEKHHQQLRTQKPQMSGEKDKASGQRLAESDDEIRLKEKQFKQDIRSLEQHITEEHTLQKARLLVVHGMAQQEILSGWEVTQATLKQKVEMAMQDNERLLKEGRTKQATVKGLASECSVCLTEFKGGNERALIRPCGHAKTCHPCASDIFNRSKLCPICRVEMSKRPMALPLKLYL